MAKLLEFQLNKCYNKKYINIYFFIQENKEFGCRIKSDNAFEVYIVSFVDRGGYVVC